MFTLFIGGTVDWIFLVPIAAAVEKSAVPVLLVQCSK